MNNEQTVFNWEEFAKLNDIIKALANTTSTNEKAHIRVL